MWRVSSATHAAAAASASAAPHALRIATWSAPHSVAAAAAHASTLCCSCVAAPAFSTLARAARPGAATAAMTAAVASSRRSFHSSAALHIVGRSRSKKLLERAEAAAEAEAEAEREARTGSKLKALLRARAAAEEAEAAAALAEHYRKPKAKRRGKQFEAQQELLAQADAEAAEAELEAEEREAAREAARAEREGSRAEKRPMFPIDFDRPADAPLEPNPAPLVASVESQLRALEGAPALRGNIGGLGFDTIDLSSRDVVESEVFEAVQRSGKMRRLSEDKDRRSQFKRVERVTERSREIIGRVLLEESMRISESQAVWQAQLDAHRETAAAAAAQLAPQPKKPKSPPAAQLMDLRRTPSFVIHDLRYSTDLAWLQVRWTLGREPFADQQPAAVAAQEAKAKRMGKRAAAEAAAAAESAALSASSSSPGAAVPWSEAKRLIDNTLERATKTVRFALGRELDLRYTPNVRFVYDEAADARKQREKKQEAELAKDSKIIQALTRDMEGGAAGGTASAGSPHSLSDLATAKSSLLGLRDTSELDLDLSSEFTPESMAADRAMDRQYDEDRKWFLPKRKQAALAERQKRKEKRFEETRKRKELLAHARKQAHGAATRGVATMEADPFQALDPRTGTDPAAMRSQLKATMAALLKKPKPADPENLKQLRDARSSLGMLNQIQALQRKAEINPVEELKKKMKRESTPQYPKNWRTLGQQFYKK